MHTVWTQIEFHQCTFLHWYNMRPARSHLSVTPEQCIKSIHLAGAFCSLLTFLSNKDERGHAYCKSKHINVNISCARLRASSLQNRFRSTVFLVVSLTREHILAYGEHEQNIKSVCLKSLPWILKKKMFYRLIFNQCRIICPSLSRSCSITLLCRCASCFFNFPAPVSSCNVEKLLRQFVGAICQ